MSAYVPPGGQPAGQPGGQPAGGHPPPGGYPTGTAYPTGPAYPQGPAHPQGPPSSPWRPPPAPAPGQGLAITALVLSGLALLVSLAAAVWIVYVSSGAGYTALAGEVTSVEGGQVSGADLEQAIAELHEDAGSFVDLVACPDTVTVSAEAVVTCRSVVDGFDWIEHVLFYDDGTFTLLRL